MLICTGSAPRTQTWAVAISVVPATKPATVKSPTAATCSGVIEAHTTAAGTRLPSA